MLLAILDGTCAVKLDVPNNDKVLLGFCAWQWELFGCPMILWIFIDVVTSSSGGSSASRLNVYGDYHDVALIDRLF